MRSLFGPVIPALLVYLAAPVSARSQDQSPGTGTIAGFAVGPTWPVVGPMGVFSVGPILLLVDASGLTVGAIADFAVGAIGGLAGGAIDAFAAGGLTRGAPPLPICSMSSASGTSLRRCIQRRSSISK